MQTKLRCIAIVCALLVVQIAQAATAQDVVGETHILATLAGRFATPSPGQENIRFYGIREITVPGD
jgi:hypothetical protein